MSTNDEETELCGEETTSGEPCQNPADSCPWNHGGDNDTGKPVEFGPEEKEAAMKAARQGVSMAGCARATGFDKSTLHYHLENDEDFSNEFELARSEGEAKLINNGLYMKTVNSSMAKFLLKASFGYKTTEKKELEHSGEVDDMEVNINVVDDDG